MGGFIYLWHDRLSNRFYLGSHWGSEDDGYVCSSTWMNRAYAKRPQNFKRRIVSRVDTSRQDLLIEEQRWLSMIKPHEIGKRYFNLYRKLSPGLTWWAYPHTAISQKLSEATANSWKRPDIRAKHITARLKTGSDPLVRNKISKSLTGTKRSTEIRRKMSLAKIGKKLSESHKMAISESHKRISHG